MIASKYFIDSAPFIYIIEDHPEFYTKTFDFIDKASSEDVEFYTSVLSISEFCVGPEKSERNDLIIKFEDFLNKLDFNVNVISIKIAKASAKLRAKYSFLKGMDALQIASALEMNCELFLTNYKRLKEIEELKMVLISSL